MDHLSTSTATSTASRKRAHKYAFIKPQPIHKSKQRTKRIGSAVNIIERNAASAEPQMEKRADEYLLVQYRPTPFRVKHRVIHEKDVMPITSISDPGSEHQDVFVREGEHLFQACVLTRNKSKDVLMEEMDKLRTQISVVIALTYMRPFDLDKDLVTMPEENPLILIQYSADVTECAHTIMRFSDTLDGGENSYPGYQALTKIDDNYHYVLVLHNYEEVISTLHNIFNSCVISTYPHLKDMGLRQEGLEKTMISVNEKGQLEIENYVCCLESRVILARIDYSYQRSDLYKTDAFRVLTNSKFITIDPKYDFGEKGMLSPSGQMIRLCGGAYEPWKNNENCQCAEETAVSTKSPPAENRFLQPGHQVEPKSKTSKLMKSETQPKASHGSMVVCKKERIYRILQHGCYEEMQNEKSSPKYHIVVPGVEDAKKEKTRMLKKVKEKKKEKEKEQTREESRKPTRERSREHSREPSKERAQMKRELESEPELERVTPPPMTPPRRCAEKSVGTTDAPSNTSQQQQQVQPTARDLLSWNPLKYFDINCNDAPQVKAEDEPRGADPPCALSLFPYPSLRKPEKSPKPIAAITTKPPKQAAPANMQEAELLPCQEQPQAESVQPKPADISEEVIRAQCSRILNLELQVNELRRELGRMKTEIIPPDEMLRCTALTSKLRELSALLADLKSQHTKSMAPVLIAQRQANAASVKSECTVETQTPQLPPPPPPLPPTPPLPRPIMKAEKVQTNLLIEHAHKNSQTNASFGWRPFIDEATQSSPPSTVPVTPKHTSSVPISTHTSSVASTCLHCRHDTGEIPLKETPSYCPYCQSSDYPRCAYVERHLEKEIMRIVQFHPPSQVLLSVLLQLKNLYHINISLTNTGEPLGCIYATEDAITEAVEADVFARFLTFFIVDASMSGQQKDKILAHTFEFFKN